MILVVDIGNTTMEFGIYIDDELKHVFRLGTKRDITSDEVGLFVTQFIEHMKLDVSDFSDVIISSVVPQVNYSVINSIRKYFNKEPYIIGDNLHVNISNLYDNPSEVGTDRLVDSYAAIHKYGAPCIVVDLGTATTCEAISKDGEYLGGMIYPGIKVGMDALYEKASKLPKVEIVYPNINFGKNTVSSMQTGAYYGYLGALKNMISHLKKELGDDTPVIATGGFARLFENEDVFSIIDQKLPLEGIKLIFDNR